jgi:hypothetical protein
VFTQDLFKPSIRLEEDVLTLMSGTSPGEDSLVPMPGTPPGKGGAAPTFEVHLGTSVGIVGQDREHRGEVAAIVGPPDPNADW